MTIEKGGESVQTMLIHESREERLSRLLILENEIQDKVAEREKLNSMANALKNEIKAKEKSKLELLAMLNSGQGTFIEVAVGGDHDSNDDDTENEAIPSDEELEANAQKGEAEETQAEENPDTVTTPGVETEASTEEKAEKPEVELPDSAEHWLLFNDGDNSPLGRIKGKKDKPETGKAVHLPKNLRAGKLEHFVVRRAEYSQPDDAFMVFGELVEEVPF